MIVKNPLKFLNNINKKICRHTKTAIFKINCYINKMKSWLIKLKNIKKFKFSINNYMRSLNSMKKWINLMVDHLKYKNKNLLNKLII